MTDFLNVEEWYNITFEKPQFNWYSMNNTYFDDITKWKKNKEELLKCFCNS